MIEKPLDRLNYYNGQRLEASDLKLEQEYHIRTRRWLNKSLYKPGIASGLDIRPEKDPKDPAKNTRRVIISPGLALDGEGREILLLEEEYIFVPGKPHKMVPGSDAEVEGLYLTIRYDEKSIEEERNGCIPKSTNGRKNGDHPAWGGPALIRTKPLFNWRDALPYESSGEIVLGEVELDDNCKAVSQINTGVRRYVGAASAAKVRQYALEGKRHIDTDNPGRIYFHIRGRQPNAVTLYLRAEKFSTLYYSEMGKHNHLAHINNDMMPKTKPASYVDAHMHTDPNDPNTTGLEADTEVSGLVLGHSHNIKSRIVRYTFTTWDDGLDPNNPKGLAVAPKCDALGVGFRDVYNNIDLSEFGFSATGGQHGHVVVGSIGSVDPLKRPAAEPEASRHTHLVPLSATLDDAGVYSDKKLPHPNPIPTEYSSRSGAPLTYVDDLQVLIGPDINRLVNHTNDILSQLRAAQPTETWDKLGNGGAGHAMATKGTGEIKLDFLPKVAFTEGEYVIQLNVANGGGRVLYNLYVE